ncbi:MAG: SPOR domain-containing protein [Gammaproteobacteria bacterium]|jgi:cell division protein FtsN
MPKDYIHRSRTNTKKRVKKRPIWKKILLLIIILFIIGGGTFYFLGKTHFHQIYSIIHNPKTGAIVAEAKPVIFTTDNNKTQTQSATIADKTTPPPRNIKFDFYQMLPKMRVTIDNSTTTTNNISDHSQYILQLASFAHQDEAADFQANIKSLGFNSKLQAVQQANLTRYRVQIGPFKKQQDAEDMRDNLQKQDINCIIIKINQN